MSILSAYPGLPTAWRGERVRRVACDRVAVIGDIHGRADLLAELLGRVGDRLVVIVGDVGDRGPDTRGVVELLVGRQAIGVLGNHDLWLVAYAGGEGLDPLALSGMMDGRPTLQAYGILGSTVADLDQQHEQIPPSHRDWLLGLSVAIDLDVAGTKYWVVHGGAPGDVDLQGLTGEQVVPWMAQQRPTDLMWRAVDPETALPLDRPVIMGHVPLPEPVDLGYVVAIDTGAGKRGGRLTALLLPERRFLTVGP